MSEPYIDAREKNHLEYLDRCVCCSEEFAVRLHLRHKCEPCVTKELDKISNAPLIDGFHWKKMWNHFHKVMDGVFGK
jgi:hypothetical protein